MIVQSLDVALSPLDVMAAAAARARPAALKLPQRGRLLIAADPVRVIRGDDVDELSWCWQDERNRWQSDSELVPIGVGWLSYDLGFGFERIAGRHLAESPWPPIEFRFYDAYVAFDERPGPAVIIASSAEAARRMATWVSEARPAPAQAVDCTALSELEPPERHLSSVTRGLAYIQAGDIYQVNLARRLRCSMAGDRRLAPGLGLWRRLQSEAPAPFGIWLGDGAEGTALVGNSPERFLYKRPGGFIETCPIKGTRPRGRPMLDAQYAAELLASEKDRAEHVMIVDLERNDLGRVCRTGSVHVGELCKLVSLPTVHHLVSTVCGQLRDDVDLPGLLRATFPGGSITGAPKIRAMEIIEELEPARRGPYSGATGWLGAAGDLDLAVAIRTALVRDGQLTLWVGGGIVADSQPEDELAETWAKARAFTRALAPR